MWICLNDAFFSIVADQRDPDSLLVRARREGDVERVFGVRAAFTPDNDYAYRASIKRHHVVAAIEDEVQEIRYENFKNSVKDPLLQAVYNRVWGNILALQGNVGAYARLTSNRYVARPR